MWMNRRWDAAEVSHIWPEFVAVIDEVSAHLSIGSPIHGLTIGLSIGYQKQSWLRTTPISYQFNINPTALIFSAVGSVVEPRTGTRPYPAPQNLKLFLIENSSIPK